MKTRFVGDVHGKWLRYSNVIYDCQNSIQVGDFGVGFHQREEFINQTQAFQAKGQHRFIRGNHDNVDECVDWPAYLPDGTLLGNMCCIGGAYSIDKDWRTPGLDWWDTEELSYEQLAEYIVMYSEIRPEIMVTHECPDVIARLAFPFYKDLTVNSRTRLAFNEMFKIHKPRLWVFGHWHVDHDEYYDGTRFICLNELSKIDIDLNGDLKDGVIMPDTSMQLYR